MLRMSSFDMGMRCSTAILLNHARGVAYRMYEAMQSQSSSNL